MLVELRARGLESDAVSIGILVNERQGLEKKYMQDIMWGYRFRKAARPRKAGFWDENLRFQVVSRWF